MGAQCVVARRAVLILSQVAQGKTLIEEMFPRSGQTRLPPEARALQGVVSKGSAGYIDYASELSKPEGGRGGELGFRAPVTTSHWLRATMGGHNSQGTSDWEARRFQELGGSTPKRELQELAVRSKKTLTPIPGTNSHKGWQRLWVECPCDPL